jgi:hypothetical protein
MIATRKLGYLALVLAAFAGCAEEPPAPAPAPTTETTDAKSAPAPEITAPAEKAAPSTEMPKIEAPQPTPATKEEAKPEGKAASVTLEPDEIAAIKKLPAGDAEIALKQLVCPVSGEHLGSMDVPLKVTAAGQTFFLCCKGCNKDVTDDPAGVVAKLKK